MKILLLCSTFPYPPTKGGTQVRTFNLLKHLTPNHELTLITQRNSEVTDEEVAGLRKWVKELLIVPRPQEPDKKNIWGKVKRFANFLLQGTPPNVMHLYYPEVQAWVDRAVAAGKFDLITCEHSVNEVYVRPQWQSQLRTAINIHSSLYRTCKDRLETGTSDKEMRDRLFLPLLKRYEQRSCSKFSTVVVTTDEDEQQMRQLVPSAEITVIPNGVDLERFPYRPADPGDYSLVFVGSLDYFVNVDAACFFAKEILPLLQEKYPDTTLTLVGSKPSAEVRNLAQANPAVNVTGSVPSIVEYLHKATVSIVPLRTGFGIKNKTLESMAAGTPIVSSDRGLEGLKVDTPDVPLRALRANKVEEYVIAITRLFQDPQLRDKLSRNGRQLIEQEYTWERSAQLYEKILRG